MTAAVDLTTLDGRDDAVRALVRELARERSLCRRIIEAVQKVGDNETVAAVWKVMHGE
jgi:hypothetical protein